MEGALGVTAAPVAFVGLNQALTMAGIKNSGDKNWRAIIKHDIMTEIDYAMTNRLLPAFCDLLTPVHCRLESTAA